MGEGSTKNGQCIVIPNRLQRITVFQQNVTLVWMPILILMYSCDPVKCSMTMAGRFHQVLLSEMEVEKMFVQIL